MKHIILVIFILISLNCLALSKVIMKCCVFTTIRKKLQIFKSIIIFNTIDMMDNFFKSKVSTKVFFHNKFTSFDVSTIPTKRMFWSVNHNIPFVNCVTPFPIIMIFSRKFRTLFTFISRRFSFSNFTHFVSSFKRKFLTFPITTARIILMRFRHFFLSFLRVFFTKISKSNFLFSFLRMVFSKKRIILTTKFRQFFAFTPRYLNSFFTFIPRNISFVKHNNLLFKIAIGSIVIIPLLSILCQDKSYSSPSTEMSIVPIAVDSRAIKATDENARNNIVATIFNAHDHTTMVSDTVTIGTGTVGNIDISSSVNITVDVSGTVTPTIRFNTITSVWEISNDGNTFLTISTE